MPLFIDTQQLLYELSVSEFIGQNIAYLDSLSEQKTNNFMRGRKKDFV